MNVGRQIVDFHGEMVLLENYSALNYTGICLLSISYTLLMYFRKRSSFCFRWINSDVSLLHLEGLFLRLRLGKWEVGLGGTGYYVACITDCKTSISVSVGGIKCSVGSQYVSNQGFLEDELKVWWSRTLRNGGKIPSTEDLETKLRQRIKLGF
ncbi:unnamed protein product [Coffea canephora]|uniref:DH200=94 genomic scaffold, scaffold_8699 n=1 Tax=Coffea canephora TaxID=49390 RepID=A0A068VN01_COFCA|nr:unnamed protein product [Coffea canephora]